MNLLEQFRTSAKDLLDTLGEGWDKLVAASGQALTRFTRGRTTGAPEGSNFPVTAESWGLLAGEVAETPTHLIVRLEAPGMEKGEFEIHVDNGVLVIRGEKHFVRQEQDTIYHVFESAYGAFERLLRLPREVDAAQAEAAYDRGVLTIRLPKREPRGARKINVG